MGLGVWLANCLLYVCSIVFAFKYKRTINVGCHSPPPPPQKNNQKTTKIFEAFVKEMSKTVMSLQKLLKWYPKFV